MWEKCGRWLMHCEKQQRWPWKNSASTFCLTTEVIWSVWVGSRLGNSAISLDVVGVIIFRKTHKISSWSIQPRNWAQEAMDSGYSDDLLFAAWFFPHGLLTISLYRKEFQNVAKWWSKLASFKKNVRIGAGIEKGDLERDG